MKQLHADYSDLAAARPIDVDAPDGAGRVVRHAETFGFAVARPAAADSPEEVLGRIAEVLGLGAPHMPGTAHLESNTSPYKHVINAMDPEGWHVDGLLEPLGTVRTTVLYCVRPALRGGATALFNSIAAYGALRENDPEAADTLLAPSVLTRHAMLVTGGYGEGITGPAFAVADDSTVSTRYSDNHTCAWDRSAGPDGSLDRALDFLRKAAHEDRYRIDVRLEAGEILLLRNDRLAHDRMPFEENPAAPRQLVRALYTQPPQERRD
ncbi:TauD/TfdA family dioxygenase [Streptomyces albidoflavus]